MTSETYSTAEEEKANADGTHSSEMCHHRRYVLKTPRLPGKKTQAECTLKRWIDHFTIHSLNDVIGWPQVSVPANVEKWVQDCFTDSGILKSFVNNQPDTTHSDVRLSGPRSIPNIALQHERQKSLPHVRRTGSSHMRKRFSSISLRLSV